ncbi:MAG: TonB-dependent receptor [Hyphomonadaceae bacterium]
MKSLSLNRLLLLTTMMFAPPAIAFAQDPAPPAPAEATADDFSEDGEIVVLGRNIPEPMRETSEVATFLSAEELQRTGDSTAAEALTRLTGLSVASDRFVYVRGLGDRYSSALLNGSPLPSPEPLRRTVPLDLFPSNILAGATVQKTYSPNYPGEFGGGIIDLQTISIPVDPFLTLKVGASHNYETTLVEGIFYHGGDSDWTGFDDGTRDVPDPLSNAIGQNSIVSDVNFDVDTLEAIGESLVDSNLMVIQEQDIAPNFDAELSAGTSWDAGRFNIGLIGVAGYDSSWSTQRAERGIGSNLGGVFTVGEDKDSLTTTWNVTANALGSLSLGWDANEIKLTTLYVHDTSREAQQIGGFDFNLPGATQIGYRESTGWYERQLITAQLAGEHEIGAFDFGWRVAGSESTREAPYERSVNFLVDDQGPFYGRANDNSLRFSELTDRNISGGVDASYTLPLSPERDAVFSAGYDYTNTTRQYDALTFVYGGGANLPDGVRRARVDFLFSPDNIDPARFEIFELTGPDDAYKGGLLVNSAWASADVEIMPLLRAAIGVRHEDGRQTVQTQNRYGAPTTAPVLIENQYWLPAATLTWNFAEDLQLRLGYSQTVARPQFRELALSPYIDPETDRSYRGNPNLVDSELQNYDARLEYYFGRNQFITGSVFYKEIENPIEEVITEPSTFNFLTRFINAPRATLYGAEFEFRTLFDMPFETPWLSTPSWLFAINYTYTSSEIEAGDGDVVINPLTGVPTPAAAFGLDGAQLQGTPENILNLQFGYEDENSQLTLLVGWVDERILQRGFGQGAGLPDIVEDPGVNVDLVYRRDFTIGGTEYTLGLAGRNLLDEAHTEFQDTGSGRLNVNTYDVGRTLSASITARF